jgi:hypothetical protein
VVVAAAVSMVVAAAIPAVVVENRGEEATPAADHMAVGATLVEAPDRKPAAVWARRELDHRQIGRRPIGRQISAPLSMTASGIRSLDQAAPAVPAKEEVQARSLATRQVRRQGSVPSVRPMEPSEAGRVLPDAATTAGVEGSAGAVASAGVADGAGALASDGPTGDLPGIPFGMVLIGMGTVLTDMGMVLTGMVRGHTATIIPTTAPIGRTILRRTDRIRRRTMTPKEAIKALRGRRQIIKMSAPILVRA